MSVVVVGIDSYCTSTSITFLFSVIGQNSEVSTLTQNFRTLKRKTSKKLKKELAEISGLKMGQVKIIGK